MVYGSFDRLCRLPAWRRMSERRWAVPLYASADHWWMLAWGLVSPHEWNFSIHGERVGSRWYPWSAGVCGSAQPLTKHFSFLRRWIIFFRDFDRRSGLEPVIADCYREIPPSRLIVLSNFSVFTRLLARLSPAVYLAVFSVHQFFRSDGSSLPYGHVKMTVGIIDLHFIWMDSPINIPRLCWIWSARWISLSQLRCVSGFRILSSHLVGLRLVGRRWANQDWDSLLEFTPCAGQE